MTTEPTNEQELRRCYRCGEAKPLSDFVKVSSGKITGYNKGRKNLCKRCRNKARDPKRYKQRCDRLEEFKAAYHANPDKPKVCAHCGETKPIREFELRKGCPNGVYAYCKTCTPICQRIAKFRIDEAGWAQLLASQNQACMICKTPFDKDVWALSPHLDHCHVTGRVRGLLCSHCNRGLGCFKDDARLLYAAVMYLVRSLIPKWQLPWFRANRNKMKTLTMRRAEAESGCQELDVCPS